VTFGPTDLVHFGEIFDEVGVGVKTSLDLSEVDDEGPGKFSPFVFYDGMGYVG
jgi:hypothetical protein